MKVVKYNSGIFWEITSEFHTKLILEKLEQKFTNIGTELQSLQKPKNLFQYKQNDSENVKKVKNECKRLQFSSGKFWYVPSDYYQRPLVERKRLLNGPSVRHLCKTLIFENINCVNVNCDDKYNSKYYAVISQYVTKINTDKITVYFAKQNEKLGKSKFNFRLTKESEKLTGFKHNATAPFLLNMPIILIGGGHVDVKIELDIVEYMKKMSPFVVDIVDELDEETIANMGREEQKKEEKIVIEEKPVQKGEEKPKPEPVKKEEEKPKPEPKKKQRGKKQQGKSKKKNKSQTASDNPNIFDIRIGRIETIKKHPKADVLYIEEIDVGEEKPRQICSGLVGRIEEKDLLKKNVLVMCNLRKAKLVGVESHGMIMVSMVKEGEEWDCSLPIIPEGVKIGDRVFYDGVETIEPVNKVNKKAMKKMIPKFCSNDNCFICYGTYPMNCSGGSIKSEKPNSIVK